MNSLFQRELSCFYWDIPGVIGSGHWEMYDHTLSIKYDYRSGWSIHDHHDHATYFPSSYKDMYETFSEIRKKAFNDRVNTIYYE